MPRASLSSLIVYYRPSKTDSAPVRGDGYEPGSSQSQRRDVAQRADRTWWWLRALRAVVKNFQMVRSRKPLLLALYNSATTLLSYPRHLYDPTWIHGIR